MPLLADLFGVQTPMPAQAPPVDDADLLRRAIQLNRGVEVAPVALAAPPPLEQREVREYPVFAQPPAQPAPAAAPPQPAPQAAPAMEGPSLGERLGRFLMAGGEGSLARGIGEATYGADRSRQTENLTQKLLVERGGLTPDQAIAVTRNPTMMNQIIPQIFGPKPANTKVEPGAAIIGPKGDLIYRNDVAAPKLTAIAPGGALADEAGNIVAQNDPKAKEPPSGYEWIDPRDPSKGVAAIAGGPATRGTGELAGKLALMKTSREAIAVTKGALLAPWGVSGAVQSGLTNVVPAWSGNIGEAQRNVRAGVEAALRIMTGAAAPETEVVRYTDLFTPNARDDEKSAKQKLALLESFMDNAEALARQGHLTRDELNARKPAAAAPSGGTADPLGIR